MEAALSAHPAVDRAVVLPDGDPAQRLVAYFTGTASPDDVRAVAAQRLPDYMVPAIIMAIPEIPLTSHGKLDRKALPAPTASGTGSGAAPSTPDEHAMADIFAAVLNADNVSMADDFFALGGHSLLAIDIMGRIREAFGAGVPLRALFDSPTPAGLLATVRPAGVAVAGTDTAAGVGAAGSASTGGVGTTTAERTTAAGSGSSGADVPSSDWQPVPLSAWLVDRENERPDRLELSFAQSRMWFLNRLDPGAADYNISLAVRLTGVLDEAALSTAVAELFRRHQVLRTVYPETDGVPEQVVLAGDVAGNAVFDSAASEPATGEHSGAMRLSLASADSEAAVREMVAAQAGRGFDVRSDLPLRAHLIRLVGATGGAVAGDTTSDAPVSGEWVLHLVMHHIASDGASLAPLVHDLSTAYSAALERGTALESGVAPEGNAAMDSGAAAADLPLQYADFSSWQREQLAGPTMAGKLEHWQHALAGIPAELTLPADQRRPRDSRQPGRQVSFSIPAETVTSLTKVASASNASVFMALHAGLAAFLQRAGAGDDLVIGSPTSGRTDPLLAPLVGFFVNTLPLRVSAEGNPSLRTLISRSRASILAAFDHDDVPFERLVEALAPSRELGRHPLFQTMLTVDSEMPTVPQLPGVSVVPEPETGSGEAKFDLSFTFRPDADGALLGTLDYNSAMFLDGTAQRLVDGLGRLLRLATNSPDTAVSDLPLLTAADTRALAATTAGSLSQAVETTTEDPDILAVFDATVREHPDATAVVADGGALTFAALAESAGKVAAGLTDADTAGQVVSVLLPRSAGTVQALLGVLRAGAAYNPIDAEYPDQRVAAILEDAAPPVVLTCAAMVERLTEVLDGVALTPQILLLEDLLASDLPAQPAATLWDPRELASIMFTSGSTGRPKGVEVSHGALAALLAAHRETLLAGISRRKVAHTTGVGFDASWDPILWLVAGHELHLISDDLRRDAHGLASYFAEHGIGAWETTPGYLRQLLTEPAFAELLAGHAPGADAFSLALGGEAFDVDLWTDVRALPGVRAWNLYGPTEATVDTVVALVAESDGPELGRPTPRTRLYVLDDRLQHVLPGAAGELYLAGAQLARGYRGRPDLTAERFVPDPFHGAGERMYRTGDVVYRAADGRLVFAGRNDGQLKIRGFRVELGEVESALRSAPGVQAAVVRAVGTGDATRLVGYVVPANPADQQDDGMPDAVRSHVRSLVPDYMVPAAVILVPEIPLTPHGKVDLGALPDPGAASRTAGLAPRTPQENTVAGIFASVLSLERAGVDESFFELGGHSFLAQPLIAQVNAALGTDLQVQSLFRAPTVTGLLHEAAKGAAESVADNLRQLLPLRSAGSKAPLFAVHPASGIGWGFASMLGALDPERPLIGLQMPGMEPGHTHPVEAQSLTELADDYIGQIRSVQPEGPYHLLGWSFGGYLSHRIATRLQETGQEVAFLAILDAFPEGQENNAGVGSGAQLWASYLEAQGYDLAGEDLATVDIHRAQEILRENHNPLGTVPADSVAAMAQNFPALAQPIRNEGPQVFHGDLLFFRATEQVPAGTPGSSSWAPYVTGTITDIPVPERHSQLLSDKALSTIMPAVTIRLGSGAE
ncbi:non-ribosomal peptide synthetase [Arthrobacter ulcerisalmonis]|nr:non-ribosomal peptide synthetase [Arthrobacter ulcerisalmonis]